MDKKLNLADVWKSQPITGQKNNASEFITSANYRIKYAASKHKITISILIAVIMLLVWFVLQSNYSGLYFYTGISMMMIALILRTSMEIYSFELLKKIDVVTETLKYLVQVEAYFEKRKKIHKPYTISTVSLYIVGFMFLLPGFYKFLPFIFFMFITAAFIVSFFSLVFFLRKKVQKELNGFEEIIFELKKTIKSLSTDE